jgi:hypothetical protein
MKCRVQHIFYPADFFWEKSESKSGGFSVTKYPTFKEWEKVGYFTLLRLYTTTIHSLLVKYGILKWVCVYAPACAHMTTPSNYFHHIKFSLCQINVNVAVKKYEKIRVFCSKIKTNISTAKVRKITAKVY